ncbi:threonine dehydrogenase-like Zn-dependent dehydrogenase [Paraburkholderia sp. WC7.3d]|uniref:Formaldehyde dehydrogenase n=1 Tax=Paraburkholderia podalyriae TaxID=1938811 RepID=A0ABR7PTJ4_9BURK|nr:hypothetical protein [Paraburkholderia podalyriae]MBC8749569.1 hypothetical protein [Paraburkholderia podalyriae]
MGENRGVDYVGHGKVEVQSLVYPDLVDPDKIDIAKVVNVQVISLDDAPLGYAEFDAGVPKKFVIDPHGLLARAA